MSIYAVSNHGEQFGPLDLAAARALGEGLSVAIIADGNGRWASRQNLERILGHQAGEVAVNATVAEALEQRIAELTLFTFSTENWNRPKSEVDFLMEFNRQLILEHGPSYNERGIRVRYLGRQSSPIPTSVLKAIDQIEATTASNRRMTLNFAFNHGGRAEITDAVKSIIRGGLDADEVDEALIAAHMQFPDMADPDLIIRTSGESRLSNFLLWRAAYSELVFMPVLWPDFRGEHLREALSVFRGRTRRFGRIEEPAEVSLPEETLVL